MSASFAPVAVGDCLAGKYRVERVIGKGAMGVVVEATNVALQQRVALKFLLSHRATNQALHERFLREARAAANLKSQHVARVMDVGTLETGAPYMVMELLDGHDLAAELDLHGPMPVENAVEYVLQLCEAIGEAHRMGIVHRDLKPANLFLTLNPDGTPCLKVIDFGVSKVVGGEHLKLTTEGQPVGSPLYMSPEQMMGKADVDARSDIWALGVILYELIAGVTPFHADTMEVLRTNLLVKPPVPLGRYVEDCPPGIEALLLQCLDKDRDRRWPDVATFAAALAPWAPARAQHYAGRVAGSRGVTVARAQPTVTLERARLQASQPAAGAPSTTAASTRTNPTGQRVHTATTRAMVALAAAISLASVATVYVLLTRPKPATGAPGADATTGTVSGSDAPPTATVSPSAATPAATAAAATAETSATPTPNGQPSQRPVMASKQPVKVEPVHRPSTVATPAPPRGVPTSGDVYGGRK